MGGITNRTGSPTSVLTRTISSIMQIQPPHFQLFVRGLLMPPRKSSVRTTYLDPHGHFWPSMECFTSLSWQDSILSSSSSMQNPASGHPFSCPTWSTPSSFGTSLFNSVSLSKLFLGISIMLTYIGMYQKSTRTWSKSSEGAKLSVMKLRQIFWLASSPLFSPIGNGNQMYNTIWKDNSISRIVDTK